MRSTYEAFEKNRRIIRNSSLSVYQDSQSRRLSTPRKEIPEKFEVTVENFRRRISKWTTFTILSHLFIRSLFITTSNDSTLLFLKKVSLSRISSVDELASRYVMFCCTGDFGIRCFTSTCFLLVLDITVSRFDRGYRCLKSIAGFFGVTLMVEDNFFGVTAFISVGDFRLLLLLSDWLFLVWLFDFGVGYSNF